MACQEKENSFLLCPLHLHDTDTKSDKVHLVPVISKKPFMIKFIYILFLIIVPDFVFAAGSGFGWDMSNLLFLFLQFIIFIILACILPLRSRWYKLAVRSFMRLWFIVIFPLLSVVVNGLTIMILQPVYNSTLAGFIVFDGYRDENYKLHLDGHNEYTHNGIDKKIRTFIERAEVFGWFLSVIISTLILLLPWINTRLTNWIRKTPMKLILQTIVSITVIMTILIVLLKYP